ncbi:MAG: penicillin-binding protein [Candidatus Omnitrophica bacterium]|nr:penicillin-binding protein [Candidatus Omnitrophota bacterium]
MYFQKHPTRTGLVFFVILFGLSISIIKLSMIQIFHSSFLTDKADKQHNHVVELEPRRGTIYDRNMHALALNVLMYSMYANPMIMSDEEKSSTVTQISQVIGMSAQAIAQKLEKSKHFAWIARKIPQEAYEKLKGMKLHGIGFVKESKRFYPNGALAAHVVGFANIDNVGLQGVEYEYDKYLHGTRGMAEFLRDARQRDLLLEKDFIEPKDGEDVVLTLDETIQFIAENALDKAFKKYNAKAGTIIVMDPKTGEVLAFANRPTFRPDAPDASSVESRTNRAVAFVYEPGSVFKIVTASGALEEGAFKEEDDIFCENGHYLVGNHILKDAHPKGHLTFQEVVEESSNIGVTKIAQKIGANKVYEYARRYRFGMKTNIGMMGEVNGLLKHPSTWSKTSIGAVPIGQEVTVTSVQLLGMIASVANDGVYMKPYYVKYIKDNNGAVTQVGHPEVVSRVLRKDIALRMKNILKGVVDRGTAQLAKMKDITAAGKTGTAQKVVNGTYSHSQFVASFIGFAPVEDPKLAIVVTIDEPHPAYYGGVVSGPVFKEGVEDSLKYLATKKEARDAP